MTAPGHPLIRRVPPVNPRDRRNGSYICLTHLGGVALDRNHIYDHLVLVHGLTGAEAQREIDRATAEWARGFGAYAIRPLGGGTGPPSGSPRNKCDCLCGEEARL